MSKEKVHRLEIGPPVPVVPYSHFKNQAYGEEFYEMAWYLVGPTIGVNLQKHFYHPHILFCIAFIEGMNMALHGIEERGKNDNPEPAPQVQLDLEYTGFPREILK